MDNVTAFRFFEKDGTKLVSAADRSCTWPAPRGKKPGAWQPKIQHLDVCSVGYHGCRTVFGALEHRRGYVFARVETRGELADNGSKFAAQEMRVLHVFSLRAVVGLACLSSAMSLENYEKRNPKDTRPREALELALRYVASGRKPAGLEAARAEAWKARAWASEAASWASEAASSAAASAEAASWASEAASAEAAWASASAAAAWASSAAAAAAWASSAAAAASEAAWASEAASEAAWASEAARRSHVENFNRLAVEYLSIVEAKSEAAGVEFVMNLVPSRLARAVQA